MNQKVDLVMVTAGCQGPSDKNHVPLGLLYVGSALERAGYDVKIRHLLPEEFEEGLRGIAERNPLWIGLSVLSGMTTLHAMNLSRGIREWAPDTRIIWAGHHASAVPDECLEEDCIDFVIHGEGEDTAVEFTDELRNGKAWSKVLGLGWKDGEGNPVVNPGRPLVSELDRYKINWELVRMEDYLHVNAHGKTPVAFYSSRGCPYKCSFCATPFYTGKSFREHSPEFVEENLAYLKNKYGVNSVFFSDDNFMINKKRGIEIIKRLHRIGVSVDTVDVRLNQIDEEVLDAYQEYGVQGIFFGFESGNDRMLEVLQKGITNPKMREKVKLIADRGITCWASGILGAPTETREEMYETIDFAMWLRDTLPEGSTVSTYRYMPLPKTYLIELAVKDGFVYPENTEEWKRIDPIGPYYTSPWIKWSTPEDEAYIAYAQELGRVKALNILKKGPWLPIKIHNFFARRIRKLVTNRKIGSGIVKVYFFLRDTYDRIQSGRRKRYTSQADFQIRQQNEAG